MRAKPGYKLCLLSLFIIFFCSLFPYSLSAAGKINCLKCHKKLTKGKFVHRALAMGCPACHTGIDGGTVPHRKTTTVARGLSSEQPDLCYGCHDQGMYSKKNVHPAIGMGCTGCHNPHSSKNAKLVNTKPPVLCFSCHDKAGFSKKIVHPPVASGDCLTCHSPHSSDEMALLVNKPVEVCLTCHSDIAHWPHFSSRIAAGGTAPQDPVRPGKPFYCGSCHEPHSSDIRFLFRFNARSEKERCLHCHQKD